jgi:hypothetical protein
VIDLFVSSPCKGEDEGEGPFAARYSARDSGFRSYKQTSATQNLERISLRSPL